MKVRFNEKKATQVAPTLILKAKDGKMDVLDLMKLIYYIDRTALLKRRWPLTGDRYVAMRSGMILSHTYDLAKGDFELPTYWGKFIVRSEGYEVVLEGDPGDDELSESELLFINKMLDSVKDFSRV